MVALGGGGNDGGRADLAAQRTRRRRMVLGSLCAALPVLSHPARGGREGDGSREGERRAEASRGTTAAFDGRSPAQQPAARFPLRVERGRRHLVDAAGAPFLLLGDSAWSLIPALKREEAEHYLSDRRARGLNAVLANLIEHHFLPDAPRNAYGEPPFARSGDFVTPNERYFAHADRVIRAAAERGMLVLLSPAYLGYSGEGQGWYREMRANGPAKLFAYGRYLGERYRDFDNILWVQGGDFDPPDRSVVRAVAEGLRSVDRKLHTFHGARGTAAMQFWGSGEDWLQVNNIYTDEQGVVEAARREYRRGSAPFFLLEARYEEERGATQQTVRQQAWQALLSGASGQVCGHGGIWRFGKGWPGALDSGGARSMATLSRCLASLPWWELQPDFGGRLLVAGIDEGARRSSAASTADGALALAYIPTSRRITLDLRKLAGPLVRARWLDPGNGSSAAVAGSPFPGGVHSLQAPPRNASGFGDWLLLLESGR